MVFINLFRWLRTNLTSLALALLLGLTVWVVANQEQNPVHEAEFQPAVPITIKGLSPGLLITNSYPTATTLRLRAQQSTWLSLSPQDILATADLTGLGPGTYHIPLKFDITARAMLVSASPSTIRIDLEEIRQRDLPVHVSVTGQLAAGYTIGTAVIDPPRATVRGPRSAVELIGDVIASVPVSGLKEDYSSDLPLAAIDANGNEVANVTIEPATAHVTLPITQDAGYRDIAIVARPIGQPPPGYYVTGITVTPNLITVRGNPEIIQAMQPYVETPVNLSNLTDDLVMEVTPDLPPGVTPVEPTPIQIVVSIRALQGSRSLTVPIQAVGLGEGLKATFSPTEVTVILSGPLPVLDKLRLPEDIIVTVDLTGLAPGTYQIEPRVELQRSDVAVESIFPMVISVTIEVDR